MESYALCSVANDPLAAGTFPSSGALSAWFPDSLPCAMAPSGGTVDKDSAPSVADALMVEVLLESCGSVVDEPYGSP